MKRKVIAIMLGVIIFSGALCALGIHFNPLKDRVEYVYGMITDDNDVHETNADGFGDDYDPSDDNVDYDYGPISMDFDDDYDPSDDNETEVYGPVDENVLDNYNPADMIEIMYGPHIGND